MTSRLPIPGGGAHAPSVHSARPAVDFHAWPYPVLCAHRGGGRLAPENTLAALRVGAAAGYRMFEFDAKLSADEVVVLFHDETLQRTTNGRGAVADAPLARLVGLDAGRWHSRQWAGEPIATLAQAARWLVANGFFANVEIKPCPGREALTGQRVAAACAALWSRARVPPLLSSFSLQALAAARQTAPDLPRAFLVGRLTDKAIEQALALSCVAIHPIERGLSAARIKAAHRAGLRLLTYTVNDAVRARRLLQWGVDGVITDALKELAPPS